MHSAKYSVSFHLQIERIINKIEEYIPRVIKQTHRNLVISVRITGVLPLRLWDTSNYILCLACKMMHDVRAKIYFVVLPNSISQHDCVNWKYESFDMSFSEALHMLPRLYYGDSLSAATRLLYF